MAMPDIINKLLKNNSSENLKSENEYLKQVLDEIDGYEYKELRETVEELNNDVFSLKTEKEILLKDIIDIVNYKKLHVEFIELQSNIDKLNSNKNTLLDEIEDLNLKIKSNKDALLVSEENLMFESFALYNPRYKLTRSENYAQKLSVIRERQKYLIKSKQAVLGNLDWSVNDDKVQGRKMVNDMMKLSLRAFNNECDECISKVKFNNIELSEKRIITSYESLNKLGVIMQVHISNEYKNLKIEELYLAYEYALKKQDEKEKIHELKERMKEEAKLQKEIETERKKSEKEKGNYLNALTNFKIQVENCSSESDKKLLTEKIDAIYKNLDNIQNKITNLDYRVANQRAGYVYIISNIGAFGENIFKIGMTRRLDPQDRINELGDNSVPFKFDVHAIIFSEDAPSLEHELNKAFKDKKVNKVNSKREFFNITLSEIKEVVRKNHDTAVEFIDIPEAAQYRESLLMSS